MSTKIGEVVLTEENVLISVFQFDAYSHIAYQNLIFNKRLFRVVAHKLNFTSEKFVVY